MIDESHDAAAERIDDQENDARIRDLAKLFSQPEKLAELIGELRREVAASNDPAMRAVLQELEAATNMTAARRVIAPPSVGPAAAVSRRSTGSVAIGGGSITLGVHFAPTSRAAAVPTIHADPRYPSPEVYAEAIALIGAVPPSAGYGVGADSENEWKRMLNHYEWHGSKTFLAASIEHCRWFSSYLLGVPGRNEDAAAFRKLGAQLSRLEKKEQARRLGRDDGEIVTKGAGRPPNKSVNGTVLRDFRLLFELGKRSRIDFAKRVLKVKSPYAVKTAEAGSASEKIIKAYLVAESPTGKKLKRENIEKN
jgi:hypothetical protein